MEVEVAVKNTWDSPYKGNVTLEWFTQNLTSNVEKLSSFVSIESNSAKNILFKVTPTEIGELRFLAKSDELGRVFQTSSTKVVPYETIQTISKSFLIGANGENDDMNNDTFKIPKGCHFHRSSVTKEPLPLYSNLNVNNLHGRNDITVSQLADEINMKLIKMNLTFLRILHSFTNLMEVFYINATGRTT